MEHLTTLVFSPRVKPHLPSTSLFLLIQREKSSNRYFPLPLRKPIFGPVYNPSWEEG